jgi:hypothetical protein
MINMIPVWPLQFKIIEGETVRESNLLGELFKTTSQSNFLEMVLIIPQLGFKNIVISISVTTRYVMIIFAYHNISKPKMLQ